MFANNCENRMSWDGRFLIVLLYRSASASWNSDLDKMKPFDLRGSTPSQLDAPGSDNCLRVLSFKFHVHCGTRDIPYFCVKGFSISVCGAPPDTRHPPRQCTCQTKREGSGNNLTFFIDFSGYWATFSYIVFFSGHFPF